MKLYATHSLFVSRQIDKKEKNKKNKQAQIAFFVEHHPIKTRWLFPISCSLATWQKLDRRSGFLINNTWQLLLSRKKDLILLDRFSSRRNEGKRKKKAWNTSVKQQADICDISFRGKGARVVEVSQQQTPGGATSAGLQLIDTLTSYINGHLPVMDDIPLQRAHSSFFSLRPQRRNTGSPSGVL